MNTGSLITLGAVGIGGYFLYEALFATPAAATTTTTGGTPSGTPAAGSPAASGTPAGATPPAAPSGPAIPAVLLVCAATRAQVAKSGDPAFTPSGADFLGSPYHWQFYWNLQAGAPALDINSAFSDTNSPISGAAFCDGVVKYFDPQYAGGMTGWYGMGDDSIPVLQESFDVSSTGALTPTGGTADAPTISGLNTPVMLGVGAAVALALLIAFSGSGRRGTYY